MRDEGVHIPVLVEEVLAYLQPRPGMVFVDGTLGDGGHTLAVSRAAGAAVRAIGIDRDPEALRRAGANLQETGVEVELRQGSYAAVASYLAELGFGKADGVLVDLGVSTLQIREGRRGFSHDLPGEWDGRFDQDDDLPPAHEWIRRMSPRRLVQILRDYGEVPRPERVADALLQAVGREGVTDTTEIARRVDRALHLKGRGVRTSTLVFQAIRIALNGELDELDRFLCEAPACLAPGGVLAAISYHSLEDRRVKLAFRALAARGRGEFVRRTRKPVVPTAAEVRVNRRARSAKLRAIRRLP